jgi:hypothetical protein
LPADPAFPEHKHMIPFDMSVSIISGQTLALSAKRQLAREPDTFVNRPVMTALLWMVLLYAPSAMFFFHGWSAWNSVYILKDVAVAGPPEYPAFGSGRQVWESIVIWLDCSALVGLFYGSFILGHRWIRAGNPGAIVKTCIAVAVALVIYCAITYDRSFMVRTYEGWTQLKASGIAFGDIFKWNGLSGSGFLGHQVFWANAIVMVIDFGPLVYLYIWFRRKGRALT